MRRFRSYRRVAVVAIVLSICWLDVRASAGRGSVADGPGPSSSTLVLTSTTALTTTTLSSTSTVPSSNCDLTAFCATTTAPSATGHALSVVATPPTVQATIPQTTPPTVQLTSPQTSNCNVPAFCSGNNTAAGKITIGPDAVAFGLVSVGRLSHPQGLKVTNSGGSIVVITGIILQRDVTNFVFDVQLCRDAILAINQTCTIRVAGRPRLAGPLTATATITTKDGATAVATVTLTGIRPARKGHR